MRTIDWNPKNKKAMIYQAGNVLYLIGWIITLIGLAISQKECKDVAEDQIINQSPDFEGEFFTSPGDEDCKKTFRFFWFMWALSTIPPLLAVIATIKPDIARGVSTSYFAVLAPLTILMTNSFYDAFDDHDELSDDLETGMKLGMSGWAILSAASLLMLLMDSLLVEGTKSSGGIAHEAPAEPPKGAAAV